MDQTAARSSTRRPVVFRDGLGRRCRVPDHSGNEKLEILCLRPELTVSDQFEPALRERVARLATFHSPEFSRLKSVERLRDPSSTLVLVSETTPGTRLCDLIATAERRLFGLDGTAAWCLVKQLVAAVATLHEEAADVAHGAISAERIVITPDAQVIVVEYALASALKHVRLSHEQFWKELRVAFPRAAAAAPLDHRSDITQIGVVALSLVLGRALRDEEYPSQISKLVESAAAASALGTPLADPLRTWLLRALQLKGRESFASAIEASATLDEALEQSGCTLKSADLEAFVARCRQDLGSGARAAAVAAEPPVVEDAPSAPQVTESSHANPSAVVENVTAPSPVPADAPPAPPAPEPAVQKPGPRLVTASVLNTNPALQFPTEAAGAAEKSGNDAPASGEHRAAAAGELFKSTEVPSDNRIWRRTAAAAALLTVISGAGWAAASHYFDVSAEPSAVAPIASTATTPPAQFASAVSPSVTPALGSEARTELVETAAAPVQPGTETATAVNAVPGTGTPVPAPSGWINVSAPSDLQVFENGTLIGSTQGGRLALAPGAHQIELVNEAIGYRSTRTVQVRSGETAAFKVDIPNGTIALNATPWAEVFIDGRSAGETPIGNLSISAGSHEVIFRHPELGEQRMVTTVTLTAPTRLSVDMRKR